MRPIVNTTLFDLATVKCSKCGKQMTSDQSHKTSNSVVIQTRSVCKCGNHIEGEMKRVFATETVR